MIEKRYIVRHCNKQNSTWYEAHYSDGVNCRLFQVESYGNFLKFTDLLKEAGYKYIENEDEY